MRYKKGTVRFLCIVGLLLIILRENELGALVILTALSIDTFFNQNF